MTSRASSDGESACWYDLSPSGSDPVDFMIYPYAYASNAHVKAGVYNTNVEWGGSSPAAVHSSAVSAYTSLDAATPNPDDGIDDHPDVAGGLVTDRSGEFTLAGRGQYWFWGQISGTEPDGTTVNKDSRVNEMLVALGSALAEK